MRRRSFLRGAASAAFAAGLTGTHLRALTAAAKGGAAKVKHPRAISMWEFSWIERRWDGAGYEDWDRALDELHERGYNALRIDPFPHLLGTDPHRTWTLRPHWNTQMWGSPDVNRITLLPALTTFLEKCRARAIKVGFSTWYRQDEDDTRMRITGPEVMAAQWIRTLDIVREAGLLDTILYTDLCNEWPGADWAPFVKPRMTYGDWRKPESLEWMHRAIALVREKYPEMPLLFSFAGSSDDWAKADLGDFDTLDPHTWMTQQNNGEFYKLTGYNYELLDPSGYTNLSLKAEAAYRARPEYWQGLMLKDIDRIADGSRSVQLPLMTTECWAIVDYKDWPLLKWDWVKELCAMAVRHAAATGRWSAMATSNFCGPQFVGMWRDVEWHRELTRTIRTAEISEELRRGRLYERL